MKSFQLAVRFNPSQMYEIKKMAAYFSTTSTAIIRNAVDDYISVFRVWQGRLADPNPPESPDNTT